MGVGVDETLGLIDFELKRLGYVTVMPLGVEVRGVRVSGGTALERAALEAHAGPDSEEGSSAFDEPEPAESMSGLLVSRIIGGETPAADHLPGLSALLRVSRDVSAICCEGDGGGSEGPTRLGGMRRRASRWPISYGRRRRGAADRRGGGRLREASQAAGCRDRLGVDAFGADDIDSVLTPGVTDLFHGDGAGQCRTDRGALGDGATGGGRPG